MSSGGFRFRKKSINTINEINEINARCKHLELSLHKCSASLNFTSPLKWLLISTTGCTQLSSRDAITLDRQLPRQCIYLFLLFPQQQSTSPIHSIKISQALSLCIRRTAKRFQDKSLSLHATIEWFDHTKWKEDVFSGGIKHTRWPVFSSLP